MKDQLTNVPEGISINLFSLKLVDSPAEAMAAINTSLYLASKVTSGEEAMNLFK